MVRKVIGGRQDVEGSVLEVQKPDPFILKGDTVIVENGLGTAFDAGADLMRREIGGCVGDGLLGARSIDELFLRRQWECRHKERV